MSLVDISEERLATANKELAYLEKKIWSSKDYEQKPQDLFKVLFAQAFIKALLKDVPGALKKYQECLELNPNSRDVKKNIELLLSGQSGKSDSQNNKKQKSDRESKDGDKNAKNKNQGDKENNTEGKDKSNQEITNQEITNEEIKGRDDSTLKRKNLNEKEIEQILKEIKNQESRIRSQENTKQHKRKRANGKTW